MRRYPFGLDWGLVPRFTLSPEGPRDPAREFNLCARCAGDTAVLQAVLAKKTGRSLHLALGAARGIVPHTSFDFAAAPLPCLSCGRVLTAEDD